MVFDEDEDEDEDELLLNADLSLESMVMNTI